METAMSVTSDFYLARAAECAREAETTRLDNVRERALRSESAWMAMANRLRRGEELRDVAAAEKALRTEQDA
jgi:hypothetical protein